MHRIRSGSRNFGRGGGGGAGAQKGGECGRGMCPLPARSAEAFSNIVILTHTSISTRRISHC